MIEKLNSYRLKYTKQTVIWLVVTVGVLFTTIHSYIQGYEISITLALIISSILAVILLLMISSNIVICIGIAKYYSYFEHCLTRHKKEGEDTCSPGHLAAIQKAQWLGYQTFKETLNNRLEESPVATLQLLLQEKEKFERVIEQYKAEDQSYKRYCEKEEIH